MNKTTWLMHLLVCNVIVISYAMETQKRPLVNRWQQMTAVLPDLVKYDGFPIAQDRYSVISFVNNRKIAYLGALQSAHPVDSLEKVAAPLDLAHDQLLNGAWQQRSGMQEFGVARLARGVLFQSEGDSNHAEHEFKEVERSVYRFISSKELFAPGEKALGHAARSCRLLTSNEHANAFRELRELKELAWIYPCWKRFVVTQCQMLLDAEYQPAFEMLKELAQGGVVDAQIHVLQDACAQAVISKDVETQTNQLKPLIPYLESLSQHITYAPLAQLVTEYLTAVALYEKKQFGQSSQLLQELLSHSTDEVPLKHVRQLAYCLLDELSSQGDVSASCYLLIKQIQNTDQKVRRAGIERVGRIIEKLMGADKEAQRASFNTSGIVAQLKQMASNNPSVCVLLAQWECFQALEAPSTSENAVQRKELHVSAKHFAQLGLNGTKQQRELLKNIITYADGVIAFCQGDLEAATHLFITLMDADALPHELNNSMRTTARKLLGELQEKGEWKARCWVNNSACAGDGAALSEQTARACLALATDMLNNAPKELIEGAQGVQIYKHVRALAQAGNKEANYIASRFLFRILHFKCAQTGLDCKDSAVLMPAFRDVCTASLAGVVGAKPFQDALTLYIKTLKNTEEGKHDLAVESALQLSGLDLPAGEKSLCLSFVRHQLKEQVARRNNVACAWCITDLLGSDNATEIAQGLALCANIFTDFTDDDFAKTSVATWQSRLQPYERCKLVEKLMAVHATGKEPQLQAQIAITLSLCHRLQASVAYQFFENDNFADKEALLRQALSYAKEAYALSSSTDHRDILCHCYLGLASFYTLHERWDEEKKMLLEGVKLKHPHCMFVYALGELSTPSSARMERSEFDAHIAMLHEAHALGSFQAGELLVEHYFDGPPNPFACGYSLDQDVEKADSLARKVGDSFAQACRIMGYLDFCRAQKESKKKGTRDLVVKSIKLLVKSAELGCEQAYAHLVEICKSGTSETRFILNFLEKKAVEKVPVGLCALGSLILLNPQRNPQYIDKAISYFNEAARLSGGMFGHYELIELYVSDPDRYMQGTDLFIVANHCNALLNAHGDIRIMGDKVVEYIGKVMLFLQAFKGDEGHQRKAESLYTLLVEGLTKIGIKVSRTDMQEADIRRAVAANEMTVVDVACRQPDADRSAVVQASAASVLLTEGLLQGLTTIDSAFEDMCSEQAQVIMRDTIVCGALQAAAQENNALSCYLLSKCLLHKAEHDAAILETFDTRKAYYQQAVEVIRRALQAEPENKRYVRQFTQVCTQACAFYQSCIPAVDYDEELCTELMAFLEPLITQEIHGVTSADAKKIVRSAGKCVYELACHGYVRALHAYVGKYLQSQSAEQQNAALEALYSCASFVHEEQDNEFLSACGIQDVFTAYFEFIKQLADVKNNGHAALVMAQWSYLQPRLHNDLDGDVLEKLKRDASHYLEKSKNAGCPAGIYAWHKLKLQGDQPISQAEFSASLKALEKIVETDDAVAELLIELYMADDKLPCGYQVKSDKARAKKIALAIKDRSIKALAALTQLAQEDQEYTKAILYKLEMVKRVKELPPRALEEIAQNCAVGNVYPREVIEYLESQKAEGNVEAVFALGGLAVRQKQFECAVALLTQAMEQDSSFEAAAHGELAYAYVDSQWSQCNIAKAVEHMEMSIRLMAQEGTDALSAAGGIQTFAMLLIKLMFNTLMPHNLELRQEAGKAFGHVVDLMQEARFYNVDSIEYPLIFATAQFMIGSDYWLLRRYLVTALDLLQKSKHRDVDLDYIGYVVSLILSGLQTDVLNQEEAGNAQRAAQLRLNIQDLLALIKKDKIVYYMVTAIEMPKK